MVYARGWHTAGHGNGLMAIRVKIEPIDRDIALLLEDCTPDGQSAALAQFARDEFDAAREINRQAIGRVPPHETFVDGQRSAALDKVRPDGVIVFEFDLWTSIFGLVDLLLISSSPVKSGRYRRSHILLADGVEVDQDAPFPDASEFVYINTQPYARKIEKGISKQAPDGVYQGVAAMAAQRFGNIARITFAYRRLASGTRGGKENRQPAIVIGVR